MGAGNGTPAAARDLRRRPPHLCQENRAPGWVRALDRGKDATGSAADTRRSVRSEWVVYPVRDGVGRGGWGPPGRRRPTVEGRAAGEGGGQSSATAGLNGMVDRVTSARRSEIMSRIRSKGMKPEMIVRRELHSRGYRYRLHGGGLPGKPDLVFSGRRKVIFVHGCFWHQHPDPACRIVRRPKSNLEYWRPKLERNVARDAENRVRLRHLGWEVLVVWECEVRTGAGFLKARDYLDSR